MDKPKSSAVFQLASGVKLIPIGDLPPEILDRLDPRWGRVAVVRADTRTAPFLIDEEMAALIEEFNQPSTIAESLIRFSQNRQRDPQEVLEETFPLLERLVAQRLIVDAETALESWTRRPALNSGDWIEDLEVLRPLQRLEDMEVLQVRLADGRIGALKLGGEASAEPAERLTHEGSVLRSLAGGPVPGVLGAGEQEGRPYLMLEWRPGSAAQIVAEEWRYRGGNEGWHNLRKIVCRIAETYAILHRRGVVHGDVNPRNVLIDHQDRVTLIDFEDAVRREASSDGAAPRDRAGVPIYLEPEYARAVLADQPPPPATAVGEQYSLAALVYELLTGVPYVDFDLRWQALLEQIVAEPPAAFADRGLQPWPAVEEVLRRALSKEPEKRFPSVGAMTAALVTAEPFQSRPVRRPARRVDLEEVIRRTIQKAAAGGPWMVEEGRTPARASVEQGAAGVAVALYRMASQLRERSLLELADLWIQRAIDAVDQSEAEENVAAASTFVGSAGVRLVEALVSTALDQPGRQACAVERAVQCVNAEVPGLDLYDGKAGKLLTLCRLVGQSETRSPSDHSWLLELGGQTLKRLWADLEQPPTFADPVGDLGMAHGWAGFLYSVLEWCRVTNTPPPAGLERRLQELANQSVPIGRGLMWPWRLPLGERRGPQFMSGWCNGSAGYVFLWTAAARGLGHDSYLELAQGAAWNAWESAQREGSLCCGLIGRAYSLLELYQVTEESLWLDRARSLARTAVDEGDFDTSRAAGLLKGELGLALLATDLQDPDRAWFPFLGPEPESRCSDD